MNAALRERRNRSKAEEFQHVDAVCEVEQDPVLFDLGLEDELVVHVKVPDDAATGGTEEVEVVMNIGAFLELEGGLGLRGPGGIEKLAGEVEGVTDGFIAPQDFAGGGVHFHED